VIILTVDEICREANVFDAQYKHVSLSKSLRTVFYEVAMRNCYKKVLLFSVIFFLSLFFFAREVYAGEDSFSEENFIEKDSIGEISIEGISSEFDFIPGLTEEYNNIQDTINSLAENPFSFRKCVDNLLKDGGSGSILSPLALAKDSFIEAVVGEFSQGKRHILFLLATGIAGGMLSAMSGLFAGNQAKAAGFYLLYLLLFSVLSVSFAQLAALSAQVFKILLQFVKVLLPAYFLAIAFCSGARTSYVFYETMLLVITLVEIFILNIILPAVHIYFVLGMVQGLSEKSYLKRMLHLMEMAIKGSIRIVFFVVLSIQGIEGMLAPFADTAAKSVVLKAVGLIPGLGSGAAGMAEAMFKSGMFLKNAIGIAGILAIILLCAYPVGKLLFYTLLYHVSCAVTEAASEARLLSCVECGANAAGLLLYTVCMGVLLFLLTIGIALATTNMI